MAEAQWLSDDEMAAWLAFLSARRRLDERLDQQLKRDAGLSHAGYEILARLSAADGVQMRMSELAAALSWSPSRLSHAIAGLERAGWVRRAPAEDDGRGSVAVLTEAGLAKLAAAAPGHVAAVRRYVFDHLTTNQVRQLAAICSTIALTTDASGRPT